MCDSRPGGAEVSQVDRCVTAGLGGPRCLRKQPLKSTLQNNTPLPFKAFLAITSYTRSFGPREAEIFQVDRSVTAGQAGTKLSQVGRCVRAGLTGTEVSSKPVCDS
ncbi:hypothetical protein GWI33_019503, partial [Rhynchophorus ferrugineus]